MTLRAKLLLAQAPLALALALVGAASVRGIATLGRSPELILRDPRPVVRGLQVGPGRDWRSFEPSCPKETT